MTIRTHPDARMSNVRPTDRRIGYLMPPSVEEWLPQRHLALFVVEVVESLDLGGMSAAIAAPVRPRIARRCG